MMRWVLYLAAAVGFLAMDWLDDLCSRIGVVSFLHGAAVGVGMIWCARWLFMRFGLSPHWALAPVALAILLFMGWARFSANGTRWVFALNFGKIVGVVGGTWYLL